MAQNKFLLVTAFTTTMFFYAGVALAGGSCAPDGDATSTCHWEVEDGVLTISGSGDMKNYFSCGVNPLCQIKDSITSVVIGDNITSIGENAFNGFHITNIDIPSSVTSIGREAFRNTDITSLTIPTSVTSIGFGAFSDTDSLTSVVIPSSVTSIGQSAFNHASNLNSIVIEGTPTIGDYAFSNIPYNASIYCLNPTLCSNKGKYNNIFGYQKDGDGVYSVTKKVNGVDTTFYYSSADKMVLGGVEEGCETAEACAALILASSNTPSSPTSVQNTDGSYTLYDTNGNVIGYKGKRIYTVEEASKLSKPTGNTFRLRYK